MNLESKGNSPKKNVIIQCFELVSHTRRIQPIQRGQLAAAIVVLPRLFFATMADTSCQSAVYFASKPAGKASLLLPGWLLRQHLQIWTHWHWAAFHHFTLSKCSVKRPWDWEWCHRRRAKIERTWVGWSKKWLWLEKYSWSHLGKIRITIREWRHLSSNSDETKYNDRKSQYLSGRQGEMGTSEMGLIEKMQSGKRDSRERTVGLAFAGWRWAERQTQSNQSLRCVKWCVGWSELGMQLTAEGEESCWVANCEKERRPHYFHKQHLVHRQNTATPLSLSIDFFVKMHVWRPSW